MNTFGRIYRLTTFGESHGPAIGGIIDGVSSGFPLDIALIQAELDRRRPGFNPLTSQRKEADKVEILSGVYEGKTLGSPIGFIIPNTDTKSADYDSLKDTFRPSHADFTYQMKYGHRDHRGGGRASARETACRVVGGAIARQFLSKHGISVNAFTSRIGDAAMSPEAKKIDFSAIYTSPTRCPDKAAAAAMEQVLETARSSRDTVGGIVSCIVSGLPVGLGEPIFGKMQSLLASAMMSIPAAKGFEYGHGFGAATIKGSQSADLFIANDGHITTATNHSGGLQGGITNGQDICFNVAFKPVPTLMQELESVDINGQPVTIKPRGRHDVCAVPRAVAVVEAMACMVILDSILIGNAISAEKFDF